MHVTRFKPTICGNNSSIQRKKTHLKIWVTLTVLGSVTLFLIVYYKTKNIQTKWDVSAFSLFLRKTCSESNHWGRSLITQKRNTTVQKQQPYTVQKHFHIMKIKTAGLTKIMQCLATDNAYLPATYWAKAPYARLWNKTCPSPKKPLLQLQNDTNHSIKRHTHEYFWERQRYCTSIQLKLRLECENNLKFVYSHGWIMRNSTFHKLHIYQSLRIRRYFISVNRFIVIVCLNCW